MIRNLSVVGVAQAITWMATFLFTLAQARYLSPEGFGELSLALSYAVMLGVVVDFGISTKLARDVAQHPATAGPALAASFVLRVVLWCLAMPVVWLGTIVLGYHAELQASILILGSALLVGGFATSLSAYFQGREEFLFPSLGSIVQRGSAMILGVGALALGQGIFAVALAYVAASVLQVLVMIPGIRRHPVSSVKLDSAGVVEMFRGAATLGCFWILGTIYYNVDMVILQRLVPAVNLAWYAAAYRLFNIAVTMVGLILGTVLYPVLSRLSAGSREALRRAIQKWFAFLVASGVFIALTLIIAADQIVALLYPAREYAEAATALRLLAPGLAAMYANGIFFLTIFALRFERRLLLMAAVLAVANPIANLALIPLLQQNGAALITSVTEMIVLVWVLAVTPSDLRGAARPVVVLKILAAAAPAAACMWLLRDWPVLLEIPAAAVVYASSLLVVGALPASDVAAIRTFIRKPRSGAEPSDARRAASPRIAER